MSLCNDYRKHTCTVVSILSHPGQCKHDAVKSTRKFIPVPIYISNFLCLPVELKAIFNLSKWPVFLN